MDISICIVNWNTKDLLYQCIRSIKEKTTGVRYEIIVVDNNSQDGSTKMLKEQFPDCRVIESKVNLGFVKGNNRAVQEASGKYILYLNPDTELVTNAIYGMFKILESEKEIAAIGCRLVNPDGTTQFTCARTFPTPLKQFSELSMLNRVFKNSKMLGTAEMEYWNHQTSREVDCLTGACIMARKDLIDRLNGFDENLFMYADDVELCYRIKKMGWKIYYLATEAILHKEGASTSQRKEKFFSTILQRESNCYFLKKHFGRLKAWQFKLAVFGGAIIRILLIILALLPSRFMMKSDRISIHTINKYLNLLLWSVGITHA